MTLAMQQIIQFSGQIVEVSNVSVDQAATFAADNPLTLVQMAKAFLELRKAAQDVVSQFDDIEDWSQQDETDRVFPWYEIAPLATALNGEEQRQWPSQPQD